MSAKKYNYANISYGEFVRMSQLLNIAVCKIQKQNDTNQNPCYKRTEELK